MAKKKKLYPTITEKMKDQILKVVSGEVNSIELDKLCIPQDMQDYLESINFEKLDIDINGWQCDFWVEYLCKDDQLTYVFHGSWYWGGYRFSIKE